MSSSMVPIGSMVPATALGYRRIFARQKVSIAKMAALTSGVWQVSTRRYRHHLRKGSRSHGNKNLLEVFKVIPTGHRTRCGRGYDRTRRQKTVAILGSKIFSAASRAISAARRLISCGSRPTRLFVRGLRERRAESVSLVMSQPAAKYDSWISRMTAGRVRERFSLQPSKSTPPKSSA